MSIDYHPEPSCIHEHTTIEAICPRCGKHGDATCPHCGAEYESHCLAEDYGFRPATPQELLRRMAEVARDIASKRNAKFWWQCFLIASGDSHADGCSMGQVARHWGVCKATVSKTCVAICASLGIPPSRAMLTREARTRYRQHNRRNIKLDHHHPK